MVTNGAIPVLVRDIIHGVRPAIWTHMRVRALDHVIVVCLDTVLRTTDAIGGLESGEGGMERGGNERKRLGIFIYWPEKFRKVCV